MNSDDKFLILVIGPSGVGKNTLIDLFLEKYKNFTFLITGTARPKRNFEKDGSHRHFYTKEEFEKGIKNNEFIEYAIVHETYYGVPKKSIEIPFSKGLNVIGEVDFKGARTFIEKQNELSCKLITIFIDFEDISKFRERILKREHLDEKSIEIRMNSMEKEMECKEEFDDIVISYEGDIDKMYEEFERKVLDLMNTK